MSAPGVGTLEHLADLRPGEEVVGDLTRAQWEARANALADALAAQDVGPGDALALPGPLREAWFVVTWAAAKLGAGAMGLPPLAAPPAGAAVVTEAQLGAAARDTDAPRRFSGAHPLPPSTTWSRTGRAVRREWDAAKLGAVAPLARDLVARLRLAPGTTLAVAGQTHDALLAFAANVTLVGGGRVLAFGAHSAVFDAVATHDASVVAAHPAVLRSLLAREPEELEALDLIGLQTLVTGGAHAPRVEIEALVGPGVLVDVLSTADLGDLAVRGPQDAGFVALDGVELRITPARGVEVRSPLAERDGWTPTGDRGALGADGRLTLCDY